MRRSNLILFLVGTCLSGLLTVAVTSTAEDTELDSGPRVIPYAGALDLAGVPYEGTADLRITLSDGEGQSWQEDHEDLQVSDGHYEVAIGSGDSLPDWVFTADDVYVRFWLREGFQSQESDFVALSSGAHGELGVKLEVSPMAYWSAQGNDLQVQQRLTVGGDTTVAGHTTLHGADGLTLPSSLSLSSGSLELSADAQILIDGSSSLKISHTGDADAGALALEGNTTLGYGDNSLQMRRGFSQFGQPLQATTVTVQGDFTASQGSSTSALLEVEPTEYELTDSDGLQAVDMGTTERRACFLSLLSLHNGLNSCHVIEEDGQYLLTSTSPADNMQTDSFCRARCLAW